MVDASTYSQTPIDSNKFELGVEIPLYCGTKYGWTMSPVLAFKVIHNKYAFRSGLIYDLTTQHSPLKDNIFYILNVGIERRFFTKKSKLLIGIDICYLHEYHNQVDDTLSWTLYHYGTGPIIGYLYKFSKRFSFQTEIGFFVGYGEEKYKHNGVISQNNKDWYFTGHRAIGINIYYNFK